MVGDSANQIHTEKVFKQISRLKSDELMNQNVNLEKRNQLKRFAQREAREVGNERRRGWWERSVTEPERAFECLLITSKAGNRFHKMYSPDKSGPIEFLEIFFSVELWDFTELISIENREYSLKPTSIQIYWIYFNLGGAKIRFPMSCDRENWSGVLRNRDES